MKKKTLLLGLVIALVLSLTSCNTLDQLKTQRAVWIAADKQVEYQGGRYKRLDTNTSEIGIIGEEYSLFLVEEDLPLLLTSWMGFKNYTNSDKSLIRIYNDYSWFSDEDGFSYEPGIYAREDIFDEVSENLKNAVFNHYYYERYYYDEVWEDTRSRIVMLSDHFNQTVSEFFQSKVTNDNYFDYSFYDELNARGYSYDSMCYFVKATDDKCLFYGDTNIDIEAISIYDKVGNYVETRYVIFQGKDGRFMEGEQAQTLIDELDSIEYQENEVQLSYPAR